MPERIAILSLILLAELWFIGNSEASDVYVVESIASLHLNRSKHYNEFNYGAGVEIPTSENTRVVGGFYRNSFYNTAMYVGMSYTPLQFHNFSLGLVGGLVAGYGPIIPMIVPTLMYERNGRGFNVVVVPPKGKTTGVITLQFKQGF